MMPDAVDIAVIGAGAAGCFCATEAARRLPSCRVAVFEAGRKPLAKLALTGGGRCNLTNTFDGIANLREVYPRGDKLMRRALSAFSNNDCCAWFEREGVRLVAQKDCRVFPRSRDAMQVVHCLEDSMREAGVVLRTGKRLLSLRPADACAGESAEAGTSAGGFVLDFADGSSVAARKVVFAPGGCSAAALRQMLPGVVEIVDTVPSLYTFRLDDDALKALSGVSVKDAALSLAGTPFKSRGDLLLTDWGVSGPAVLRLSSYAARFLAENEYRASLLVNWLGANEVQAAELLAGLARDSGTRMACNVRPDSVPDRLWRLILTRSGIREDARWSELKGKSLARLVSRLTADEYRICGRAKFKDEFVTCGGVALSGVNLNTLESKSCPGLFFAGEVLDVDAVTGGFNLQAAWSTAACAARAL